MQLRRFLGNFAKVYLAIGALSVSAFAGADEYHSFTSGDYHNLNNGPYHSYGDHPYGDVISSYNPGCSSNSCCGSPVNEPPVCSWGYNPPAYSKCGCETNGSGFFDSFGFRADFLWWRANEEGLELGTQESLEQFLTAPTTHTIINRSRTKRPNFKYDPGFRIGLINYCVCDSWDTALNWTHFHTKAHVTGNVFSENNGGSEVLTFYSDWERIAGFNPLAATGRYTLNLDLVDLEFGRKFYVSSSFVLRPQFGLRFARIHQNYRVASESIDFISQAKSRSNFLAVGPRVGLDIELHVGCGLSLFGQAAGSIVFGKFDNHSRENATDFTFSSPVSSDNFEYEAKSSAYRSSRSVTDLAFGVKWDRCFEWCNRSHPVSLAFAWEHHAFYDMNNFNFVENGVFYDIPDHAVVNGAHTRKQGNLYTQGLTVSLSFGF